MYPTNVAIYRPRENTIGSQQHTTLKDGCHSVNNLSKFCLTSVLFFCFAMYPVVSCFSTQTLQIRNKHPSLGGYDIFLHESHHPFPTKRLSYIMNDSLRNMWQLASNANEPHLASHKKRIEAHRALHRKFPRHNNTRSDEQTLVAEAKTS